MLLITALCLPTPVTAWSFYSIKSLSLARFSCLFMLPGFSRQHPHRAQHNSCFSLHSRTEIATSLVRDGQKGHWVFTLNEGHQGTTTGWVPPAFCQAEAQSIWDIGPGCPAAMQHHRQPLQRLKPL